MVGRGRRRGGGRPPQPAPGLAGRPPRPFGGVPGGGALRVARGLVRHRVDRRPPSRPRRRAPAQGRGGAGAHARRRAGHAARPSPPPSPCWWRAAPSARSRSSWRRPRSVPGATPWPTTRSSGRARTPRSCTSCPPTGALRNGDLVLIDAGAEYRGYASDITRTYPVGGRLSPEQQELHALVHAAERAAIERCVPGTEWVDVHLTAAQVIAEGLVAFGLLRGEPSALVESGAAWLFFPHGIGHLVGLGVRDAGGPLRERRDTPSPIANLRINLPLAARLRGHGGAGDLLRARDPPGPRAPRRVIATRWTGTGSTACWTSAASASRTTCTSRPTATRSSPRTCPCWADRARCGA